jgi:hypothetical protein
MLERTVARFTVAPDRLAADVAYGRRSCRPRPIGSHAPHGSEIETLFGDAKHNLALVRLRLRGLSGARDEFLLTAAVQNLKRLAVHATRPPPQPTKA